MPVSEEAKKREPVPAVIWWLLMTVGICFMVMWSVGGLSRTLWWFGFLVGSIFLALASTFARDTSKYESAAHTVGDILLRLFWTAAVLIFLFGVLITGSKIVGPVLSAFTGGSRPSEDLPDNWRR